jgi:hypothetical protein
MVETHVRPDSEPSSSESTGTAAVGDVDIGLMYGRRITYQEALADYTGASGRSFGRSLTS